MKKDDHLNLDNQRPGLTEDRELNHLLESWQTPETPGELDQRVLASYRSHFNRGRSWRRWLAGSIRIPVPIVAATVFMLCATSFLAVRKATTISIQSPPMVTPAKFVQIPVPVIREKIVTRVIRPQTGQGSPKPDSINPARGAQNATQSDSAGLANFRPVEEITIVVISEENRNEK